MQTFDAVFTSPQPRQRALLQRAALRFRASVVGARNRCIDLFVAWQRRAAERALLAAMTERELRDVGLARGDVLVEADKPFWRA